MHINTCFHGHTPHTHMLAYTHTHAFVNIHIHVLACTHIQNAHMPACTHMHIYTCLYEHMCTCACMHTYIHPCTCACMHICTSQCLLCLQHAKHFAEHFMHIFSFCPKNKVSQFKTKKRSNWHKAKQLVSGRGKTDQIHPPTLQSCYHGWKISEIFLSKL